MAPRLPDPGEPARLFSSGETPTSSRRLLLSARPNPTFGRIIDIPRRSKKQAQPSVQNTTVQASSIGQGPAIRRHSIFNVMQTKYEAQTLESSILVPCDRVRIERNPISQLIYAYRSQVFNRNYTTLLEMISEEAKELYEQFGVTYPHQLYRNPLVVDCDAILADYVVATKVLARHNIEKPEWNLFARWCMAEISQREQNGTWSGPTNKLVRSNGQHTDNYQATIVSESISRQNSATTQEPSTSTDGIKFCIRSRLQSPKISK